MKEKCKFAVEKASQLCKEKGHELVYLTIFGSHLYGTDDEFSDLDFKGLYLPNVEAFIREDKHKTINWSSGKGASKNTKDDIDLELTPINVWLKDKVRQLEVNALDVLFSLSNENGILYKQCVMDKIYGNLDKLFKLNPVTNDMAYVHYAHRQAKKYGLKGTTVGILKRLIKIMDDRFNGDHDAMKSYKLASFADLFVSDIGVSSTFYLNYDNSRIKNNNNPDIFFLVLGSKQYMSTIKLSEFYHRVVAQYDSYGDRAKQAEFNKGIDWKALSHAVRAIEQMKVFFDTGQIQFPLSDDVTTVVKAIKHGSWTWKETEAYIIKGFADVEAMERSPVFDNYVCDYQFINELLVSLY